MPFLGIKIYFKMCHLKKWHIIFSRLMASEWRHNELEKSSRRLIFGYISKPRKTSALTIVT